MPVQIFCFTLYSILLTRLRNVILFNTTFALTTQKRSRFEPGPPSPLFVATPLYLQSIKASSQKLLWYQVI